tara:strand:+ start:1296 stop:1547 length:252 start_codon:yes stop_codon:yes gene_type:complete
MASTLTKMKKADLIDYIEGLEETRFENFKLQLGLPYDEEESWINYIKKLQDLNAERLNDCQELIRMLEVQKQQLQAFVLGSNR